MDFSMADMFGHLSGTNLAGSGTIGTLFDLFRSAGLVLCPIAIIMLIISTFIQKGDERAVKKNIQTMVICVILYAVLKFVFITPGQTAYSLYEPTKETGHDAW